MSSRALGFGAWYGNRQIWFLGTDGGGRVALYRGLPYDLPLGINLYQERYASPIQTSSVPGSGATRSPGTSCARAATPSR